MRRLSHIVWIWVVCAFATGALRAESCPALADEADAVAALRDSDPAAGVTRGEQALAQARATRCIIGEAMLLAAIGNNLHILGGVDDAVTHYREALAVLPADATPAQRSTVYRGAGVALADAGHFVAALEHYLIALQASRDADDTLNALKTAGNIGNLYNSLGELDRAREFHEQALRDAEAIGFRQGVAGSFLNLGAVAVKAAQAARHAGDTTAEREARTTAIHHHEQALAVFSELGNERGVGHAETSIAQGLASLGHPADAMPHFERALALQQKIGDRRGEINALVNMAAALIALGRFPEAAQRLDDADRKVPEKSPGMEILISDQRVELAEAQGDFAGALSWQRHSYQLAWTIASEQHNANALELQARFDTRQQAQEIQLLRSQAEVRELELARQRLIVVIAVIVTLMVIVLVAVLYSRLRLGRRTAVELQRVARTDPVTGLLNRRRMIECIEQAIRRAREDGRTFSLLMIDVDRFKAINDQHGHGVGDAALRDVARRLASRLRGQDVLARWGGEEFLVLLPGTGLDGGRVVAENLRNVVAGQPLRIDDVDIALSVSLGLAEYRPGMSVDACVNQADQAMYVGKRDGGNRVAVADAEAVS